MRGWNKKDSLISLHFFGQRMSITKDRALNKTDMTGHYSIKLTSGVKKE